MCGSLCRDQPPISAVMCVSPLRKALPADSGRVSKSEADEQLEHVGAWHVQATISDGEHVHDSSSGKVTVVPECSPVMVKLVIPSVVMVMSPSMSALSAADWV